MEETIRALSVPAIVSIVYGCINLYKQLTCGEEKYMRLIPIIAAIIGVAVGIFVYYAFPAILTAENIWQAIIIGGASGLTATGANQVFKQINKSKGDENGSKK